MMNYSINSNRKLSSHLERNWFIYHTAYQGKNQINKSKKTKQNTDTMEVLVDMKGSFYKWKRNSFIVHTIHSFTHSNIYVSRGIFSRIIQKLRNTINKKVITCIVIKENSARKSSEERKPPKENNEKSIHNHPRGRIHLSNMKRSYKSVFKGSMENR